MINQEFERRLSARKRTLSRFLAREMVFDFIEGRLDSTRQEAMVEHLAKDKELAKDVEAMRRALAFVDQMSAIEVGPDLIAGILATRVGWARWIEKLAWRNWPDVARWSIEATVVAALLAALVSLLPMNRIARWLPKPAKEFVLAEVAKSEPQAGPALEGESPAPTASAISENPDAEGEDSEAESTKNLTPKPHEGEKASKVADIPAPTPPVVGAPTAPPTGKATEVTGKSVSPRTAQTGTAEVETESEVGAASANKSADKKPRGFVYRAFLATPALDETTTKVKSLVESLGGEKAGQVDLGWRKPNGTYFHFSLPESNYDQLLEQLRSFGPVRIYKDAHWRVMPEGQIRLILFVEDATLKK